MESHFTHQATRPDTVSSNEKFSPSRELPASLRTLHTIAEKYYSSIQKAAAKSDDNQEFFTSAGEHYVKGAMLTAMMALRAAASIGERSA